MPYEVQLRCLSFDTRDEADQFLNALTDALMAMPEAEGVASLGDVVEAEEDA